MSHAEAKRADCGMKLTQTEIVEKKKPGWAGLKKRFICKQS
ncbi:hypothetical protein [Bdellovibrio bacteriovorus]